MTSPGSQQTDLLAIASLVAAGLGIVLDCCCGYVAPLLSVLAIVLGIVAIVQARSTGSGTANIVIASVGTAVGLLNVLFWVAVIGFGVAMGGLGAFPVDPDRYPPPSGPGSDPPPQTNGPQMPGNEAAGPNVFPEPTTGADTALIELASGDHASVAEITSRLGIEEGFEVIAVIHRHERWFPVAEAGMIVLRRTTFADDFTAWAAEVDARDPARWEDGTMPNDEGVVETWTPGRCFGMHELVRPLPQGTGVGPYVIDVETDDLRPYRLRPTRVRDIEEGYRHNSRLDGEAVFIQGPLRARRASDDVPLRPLVQLGGDLFDVTFGDVATLYVFGDGEGVFSACSQD